MIENRRSSAPPYFDSTDPAQEPRRRIILLSPHCPPGQAAGALRWQKLARFAAERGWGLDVLCFDPEGLAEADESRLADLPPGVRIFPVPPQTLWLERVEKSLLALKSRLSRPGTGSGGEPSGQALVPSQSSFAVSELRGWPRTPREWIRAYDAAMEYARDRAWALAAAATAERFFEPASHRLVVSCGPPNMTHEGGRVLAQRCRRPFVVDMRDLWSLAESVVPGYASPVWRRLSEHYEPRVISRADLVVMNTPLACDAMKRTYPEKAAQIISVLNGWDEEPVPEVSRDGRFLIAFVGTIYLDRDPRPFLAAAGRVVRELRLSPEEFGVEFVGNVHSYGEVATTELAAAEGLREFFRVRSYVPRSEAMELQARATLLLNLPQSLNMAIPSKVYEYMRFPAWLLSLSDPASSTGWLLREAGADVVAPDDVDAIASVLRQRVLEHRGGQRPAPLTEDARFSRRAQAQRLFDAIERLS